MKYKDGVIIQVIKVIGGKTTKIVPSDKIISAMEIADALSKKISGQEIVVTSMLDGVHSKNSLHYGGNAFDLRVWIYNQDQINDMVVNLKSNLGKDYDTVFEGDHIHVEYDPK